MQNEEEKNKVLQEFEGLLLILKTQNNNSNALRDKLINLIRTHIDPNSEYIKELQERRGDFYPQITKYQYNNKLTQDNLDYTEKVIIDCIQHIKSYGLHKPLIIQTDKKLNFLSSVNNEFLFTIMAAVFAAGFAIGQTKVERIPIQLPSLFCTSETLPNTKTNQQTINKQNHSYNDSTKININNHSK